METLNLNKIPSGSNPVVHCSQYDVGRVFRFNLFEGSGVVTLDGTEVIECNVRKLDGTIVTVAVTNTSDSYVDVVTTEQMTAVHGSNYGEIVFKKGSDVIGTVNFILQVEKSPLEGGITSDSSIYNLETQVADIVSVQYDSANVIFDNAGTSGHGIPYTVTSEGIKTMVDDAIALIPEELNDLSDVDITTPTNGEIMVYNNGVWENQANPASTTNFAPDYDDTATYNTNDKVIYQGLMYACLEDSVTGAWDSTKWQNISVADYNAELLPIQSGSATNTKDYIDTGLSGKADTSTTYTKTEVDNLLGDKLDSAYLVKTNNGSFSALVKVNQVWLIMVQRVSLNTSCVLLCHNYNNSVITKEIVLDSGMAYVTNSQGTVSITYGGSGESVRGGAYRLY